MEEIEEEELRWLLEELTEIIDDDCKTASRSIKKVRDIVCLAKARQAGREC
jgi:hypothetical protein